MLYIKAMVEEDYLGEEFIFDKIKEFREEINKSKRHALHSLVFLGYTKEFFNEKLSTFEV